MQIYDVLKKDHEKVKNLLTDLVSLNENQMERRNLLIQQIRNEVVPHARAEESVFYNPLRTIDETKNLVMHSYQEHMEAEMHLRMLQVRDRIDAEWKETAFKLKKALEHHITEEENKIFTAAQEVLTDEEATDMAMAFERLKPEVQKEGFVKTTLDMISNMMPPRFSKMFKDSSDKHP